MHKFNPIVQSLFDTDWYKILMLQFIWKHYKDVPVTWSVKNRTKSVILSDHINIDDLRAQLDYVRGLQFDGEQFSYTFKLFGDTFETGFYEYLLNGFKLSDYDIEQTDDGQLSIIFSGTWAETTMWEIYVLPILNELRIRSELAKLTSADRMLLLAKGRVKLANKLNEIRQHSNLRFSDFSTRRRFSFEHQHWACRLAQQHAPDQYVGSSNVYISYLMGTKPIGTNAHELPMVAAALAADMAQFIGDNRRDQLVRDSQYMILDKWAEMYPDYKIMLPDTFGSHQFLRDAPKHFADWTGIRVDSMQPDRAAGMISRYYYNNDVDSKKRTIIFSDGLDVDDIVNLNGAYNGDIFNVMFGWGTLFGNDFRGCAPEGINIDPISIVCKVRTVMDRSAVKLSDNYEKAIGTPEEIEYYKRVFGDHKLENQKVIV